MHKIIFGLLFFAAFIGLVSAGYTSSYMNQPPNYQSYYSSGAGENLGNRMSTYWAALDDPEQCRARQDVVLSVAPAGCSPSVVRSDLLAEQNVPVFCQVNALQLNPLIEIDRIDNIRFSGNKYPQGVVGAGFHPIRATLRTRSSLLGSPLINNIGYVVVVLKKNANESSLPEFVNITLKGVLEYDAGNAFGIGNYEFILEEQSDAEWDFSKNKQSFLRGNYFLKLERAEPEYALVSLYRGDQKLYTIRLDQGKASKDIYLPGFYCQAAIKFEYSAFEAAQKSARIEVSDSKGTETIDVYEGSQFLDGECRVREIKTSGGGEVGNVTIACDNNNRIMLQMKPLGAEFAVGASVNYYSDPSKGDYRQMKVLAITTSNLYVISDNDGQTNLSVHANDLKNSDGTSTKKKVQDVKYQTETEEAFNSAIAEYEKIANEFPAEKEREENDITYAEQALVDAKNLAKDFGKSQTRERIINRLINEYPNSVNINEYKNELSYLDVYDTTYSENMVLINNDYKTIRLVGLTLPKKSSSLTFSLGTRSTTTTNAQDRNLGYTTATIGQYVDVTGAPGMTASIERIDGDRATLYFKCPAKAGSTTQSTSSITVLTDRYESQSVSICGNSYSIAYSDSTIERVARVKVYPKAIDTRTETNLSVAIGIEKRAIKLNPEKTLERIENINASIKKWESISNSLGNAVSGLKAACFATSAALTVKNFFSGLDGTALARQKVMQGDEGWSERCRLAYQKKTTIGAGHDTYESVDDCIFQNKDLIDAEISAAKDAISKDNSDIDKIINRAGNTRDGGIFSGEQAIYDNVARDYISDKGSIINQRLGTSITVSDYGNGTINYETAKEVVYYDSMLKSGKLTPETKKQIEEKLAEIKETVSVNQQRNKVLSEVVASSSTLKNEYVNVYSSRNAQKGYWTGKTASQLGIKEYADLNANDNVALAVIEGKTYAFKLSSQPSSASGNSYYSQEVYEMNSADVFTKVTDQSLRTKLISDFPQFEKVNEANYRNVYQSPEIRYFETDPYKGVPEVVPIDVREGWYAGIRNDIPLMGAKSNVDASGAVSSFWLCNVGKNGIEEFRKNGFGEDICKRFDFYTGQALDEFPGISDRNRVNRLVSTAVNAIKEAQQQYKSGLAAGRTVKINGENIKVGNPALTVTGSNCQDFMSADDCNILFNVCDPVICPNTRCDLGGQFPVQDVVQSGVVGSALLCLPNFGNPTEGGVAIPVCLTGLKAGIDGYLSIMKSHRDCLQKNIETGEMTGICDQIYSIYLCDFFWKQIAPAVNVLLPKLIEYMATRGKQARGGGEYMTVMFAWENAQKSVDYFTQSYASNSFKAFNLRNTQDIGDQFCKSFVSTKVPSKFKTLLEPDSPVQFYAYFDSSTLSTATVPATAQYKVYYHIFAGNDFGAYYSIYLKDAPETSYYVANPTIPVASGFIAKGQTADETRDFSAPEGYKQLCVRINDEEKCGFKQVTTDFGINYVSNKVIADEITEKGITSESECISGGGLSNTALLNANAQSILESAADAKIYEKGIVRVCATDNPASSTDPARYVQVGYCDSSQKVKCWLDKKSVDNALVEGDKGTRNSTLSELGEINREYLALEGKLVDSGQILTRISQIKKSVDKLIKEEISRGQGNVNMGAVRGNLTALDEIILNGDQSGVVTNAQKASLLTMKGQILDAIARNYIKNVARTNVNSNEKIDSPANQPATTSTPGTTATTGSNIKLLGLEFSGVFNADDYFIFKWDNGPKVKMNIRATTGESGAKGWYTLAQFQEYPNVKNGGSAMSSGTVSTIERIMEAKSWNEMIEEVLDAADRSSTVKIYFPVGDELSALSVKGTKFDYTLYEDRFNNIVTTRTDAMKDVASEPIKLLSLETLQQQGITFNGDRIYLNNQLIGTVNSNTNVINIPQAGLTNCEANSVYQVCTDINGLNFDSLSSGEAIYGFATGGLIVDGEQKEVIYLTISGNSLPIYLYDGKIFLSAVLATDSQFTSDSPVLIGAYTTGGTLIILSSSINPSTNDQIISLSQSLKDHIESINGMEYQKLSENWLADE